MGSSLFRLNRRARDFPVHCHQIAHGVFGTGQNRLDWGQGLCRQSGEIGQDHRGSGHFGVTGHSVSPN